MKRIIYSLSVLGLAALLAGCGINFFNGQGLVFSIETGALGYEVTQTGITVSERILHFRSTAGALGATVTGYTIEFFDQNGNVVNGGDNISQGSLNIFVPPGIQCDDPDDLTGCTANSPGATYAEGPEVQTQPYQLLPAGVIFAHLNALQPAGWYGDITFTGFTTTGSGFTTRPFRLAISPPS